MPRKVSIPGTDLSADVPEGAEVIGFRSDSPGAQISVNPVPGTYPIFRLSDGRKIMARPTTRPSGFAPGAISLAGKVPTGTEPVSAEGGRGQSFRRADLPISETPLVTLPMVGEVTPGSLLEQAPTAAAIAASVLGPAALLPRLATVGASSGGARAFVEMLKSAFGMKDASSSLGEGAAKVGLEAGGQTLAEALPFVPHVAARGLYRRGLNEEAELASNLLERKVTNRDVGRFASEHGFPPTVPEMAESKGSLMVQHLAETSMLGVNWAKDAWKLNHRAAKDFIDETMKILGPKTTRSDIGALVGDKFEELVPRVRQRFNEAYNRVREIDPDLRIDTKLALPKIRELRSELESTVEDLPALAPKRTEAIATLKNIEDTILKQPKEFSPALKARIDAILTSRDPEQFVSGIEAIGNESRGQLTLSLAHTFRSGLWEDYRAAKQAGDSQLMRVLSTAAHAIDESIDKSAEAATPEVRKMFRAVNASYKNWIEDLDIAEVEKIVRKHPDDVGKWMAAQGPHQIAAIRRVVENWGKDPLTMKRIRVGFLNEIMKDPNQAGLAKETSFYKRFAEREPVIREVLGRDKAGKQAFENLVMLGEAERMMPRLMNPSYTAPSLRAHWLLRNAIEAGLGYLSGKSANEGEFGAGPVHAGLAVAAVEGLLLPMIYSRRATFNMTRAIRELPRNRASAAINSARAIMIALGSGRDATRIPIPPLSQDETQEAK